MMKTLTTGRPARGGALMLLAGLVAVGALAVSTAAMNQSRTAPGVDRERAAEARERAEQERERAERERDRAIRERDRVERQREQRTGMEHATLRGQRVAVMVGEGLHDMETLAPIAYLANRGARVTVIGIEPGLVTAYNSDIAVRVEQPIARANVNQFDALVLPGGRGPAVLRENDDAVQFAKAIFESGKPVAAICHGPQVLVTAGVLEGRMATCIADISSELREAGAEYKDEPVVKDGNLITSRIPDDIPAFVKAIEELMIEARAERGREGRPGRPGAGERDREGRPGRDGRGGRGGEDRGGDGERRGRGRGGRGG